MLTGCSTNTQNDKIFELEYKVIELTKELNKVESQLDSIKRGKFPYGKLCSECPVTQ